VAEVAATPRLESSAAEAGKPAKAPRKPSRALDILILVVRVKIVAVSIVLIAYLLLSGIIHL
jgi:hypothetical protein